MSQNLHLRSINIEGKHTMKMVISAGLVPMLKLKKFYNLVELDLENEHAVWVLQQLEKEKL